MSLADAPAAPTRVEQFFEALLARDASGRSWLGALLAGAPGGVRRFGDLLDADGAGPGSLLALSALRAVSSGRRGCFEYLAVPPRELLAWFIDHPDELSWPHEATQTAETQRLRRALVLDQPPGSRSRAQERAHELLASRSPLSKEWWRLQDVTKLDCVLITDRLVVTIEGKGAARSLAPASEWYPHRSMLVATIEAAKVLAQGRRWASLLLSEKPLQEGSQEQLERALRDGGAPHLDSSQRAELCASYLGNLTWRAAGDAVGVPDQRAARP